MNDRAASHLPVLSLLRARLALALAVWVAGRGIAGGLRCRLPLQAAAPARSGGWPIRFDDRAFWAPSSAGRAVALGALAFRGKLGSGLSGR
jgi:hypothetical protein